MLSWPPRVFCEVEFVQLLEEKRRRTGTHEGEHRRFQGTAHGCLDNRRLGSQRRKRVEQIFDGGTVERFVSGLRD